MSWSMELCDAYDPDDPEVMVAAQLFERSLRDRARNPNRVREPDYFTSSSTSRQPLYYDYVPRKAENISTTLVLRCLSHMCDGSRLNDSSPLPRENVERSPGASWPHSQFVATLLYFFRVLDEDGSDQEFSRGVTILVELYSRVIPLLQCQILYMIRASCCFPLAVMFVQMVSLRPIKSYYSGESYSYRDRKQQIHLLSAPANLLIRTMYPNMCTNPELKIDGEGTGVAEKVYKTTVWAFGVNDCMNLGIVTEKRVNFPKRIEFDFGEEVARISASNQHTLFLTIKGRVFGCGNGRNSQLGSVQDKFVHTPRLIPIPDGEEVIDMAAGPLHSVFVTKQGNIYVCGMNTNGCLGLGKEEKEYPLTLAKTYKNCPAFKKVVTCSAYTVIASEDKSTTWFSGKIILPSTFKQTDPVIYEATEFEDVASAKKHYSAKGKAEFGVQICNPNMTPEQHKTMVGQQDVTVDNRTVMVPFTCKEGDTKVKMELGHREAKFTDFAAISPADYRLNVNGLLLKNIHILSYYILPEDRVLLWIYDAFSYERDPCARILYEGKIRLVLEEGTDDDEEFQVPTKSGRSRKETDAETDARLLVPTKAYNVLFEVQEIPYSHSVRDVFSSPDGKNTFLLKHTYDRSNEVQLRKWKTLDWKHLNEELNNQSSMREEVTTSDDIYWNPDGSATVLMQDLINFRMPDLYNVVMSEKEKAETEKKDDEAGKKACIEDLNNLLVKFVESITTPEAIEYVQSCNLSKEIRQVLYKDFTAQRTANLNTAADFDKWINHPIIGEDCIIKSSIDKTGYRFPKSIIMLQSEYFATASYYAPPATTYSTGDEEKNTGNKEFTVDATGTTIRNALLAFIHPKMMVSMAYNVLLDLLVFFDRYLCMAAVDDCIYAISMKAKGSEMQIVFDLYSALPPMTGGKIIETLMKKLLVVVFESIQVPVEVARAIGQLMAKNPAYSKPWPHLDSAPVSNILSLGHVFQYPVRDRYEGEAKVEEVEGPLEGGVYKLPPGAYGGGLPPYYKDRNLVNRKCSWAAVDTYNSIDLMTEYRPAPTRAFEAILARGKRIQDQIRAEYEVWQREQEALCIQPFMATTSHTFCESNELSRHLLKKFDPYGHLGSPGDKSATSSKQNSEKTSEINKAKRLWDFAEKAKKYQKFPPGYVAPKENVSMQDLGNSLEEILIVTKKAEPRPLKHKSAKYRTTEDDDADNEGDGNDVPRLEEVHEMEEDEEERQEAPLTPAVVNTSSCWKKNVDEASSSTSKTPPNAVSPALTSPSEAETVPRTRTLSEEHFPSINPDSSAERKIAKPKKNWNKTKFVPANELLSPQGPSTTIAPWAPANDPLAQSSGSRTNTPRKTSESCSMAAIMEEEKMNQKMLEGQKKQTPVKQIQGGRSWGTESSVGSPRSDTSALMGSPTSSTGNSNRSRTTSSTAAAQSFAAIMEEERLRLEASPTIRPLHLIEKEDKAMAELSEVYKQNCGDEVVVKVERADDETKPAADPLWKNVFKRD